MKTNSSLSVIVPVFNEEETLTELINRTITTCKSTGHPFELILVDDGSRDSSADIISSAAATHDGNVVGIILNRNYGQHSAIMAGFKQAQGEIVITLDADLQNPPEEISALIQKMDEGFDVVGGVRVNRSVSPFRKHSSYLINKITAKVTGIAMNDYGCMLRAYRRYIVQAMLECHERSTFIPVLANSFARKTAEVEVRHASRQGGNSKYSLWKLINLQFDLLTSMTTLPLRLMSIVGITLSTLGIGFGFLILILRLVFGTEWAAQGVFTLLAILFILIGIQFIAMGMLGEYLARVYTDVRARPRYFVHKIVGKTQLR